MASPPILQESSQLSSATSPVSDPLPAAMQRFTFRPLRRSSSRIQRWVQDQQKRHSAGESISDASDASTVRDTTAEASDSQPWLNAPSVTVQCPLEDSGHVVTLDDFVMVDEDDRQPEFGSEDAQVSLGHM
jgi:hypothetical protein